MKAITMSAHKGAASTKTLVKYPMLAPLSRRNFLKTGTSLLLLPAFSAPHIPRPVLKMGLIADLHHGLAKDAMRRLDTFMQAVDAANPQILLQMGDFNFGKPDSRECMALWQQFNGPRYHVLGNHDMDFLTKEAMVDFWEMPAPYYSFDRAGYHFVILDRNNLRTPDGYVPYAKANFYVDGSIRAFADPEQLDWLRKDLASTNLPTLVFVHQGLGLPEDGVKQTPAQQEIEDILESVVDATGQPKVQACFCGHHHLDRYRYKAGVHYVWINSASYYWVGDAYGRMAYYTDPLFAFVTLYDDGLIEITGSTSAWQSPTPGEMGFPGADHLNTYIRSRSFGTHK